MLRPRLILQRLDFAAAILAAIWIVSAVVREVGSH